MLEIKPISSKSEQEAACARCAIPYDADRMAYGVTKSGELLGVAQFTVEQSEGFIKNIATAVGLDDFEALFLMGRAVLNFIDLCGIRTAVCAEDACPEPAIAAIGFFRGRDGLLRADITGKTP